MKKAVYPGSFDPLSNGHLDIINRSSKLFDELHILVSINIHKKTTFNVDERISMIEKCVGHLNNVKVCSSSELVVDYCQNNDIFVIIRGLRNYQDYEAEFSLYQFNKDINSKIETIFLFPSTRNLVVTSSAIKELIKFNVDISNYVPKIIIDDILKVKH